MAEVTKSEFGPSDREVVTGLESPFWGVFSQLSLTDLRRVSSGFALKLQDLDQGREARRRDGACGVRWPASMAHDSHAL